MDARRLRVFLAIVDEGGFGRAADHLHLAQPSLSQTIAGLERELGVPLFHRVGRRAVLSSAGEQLVEPARRVLRDLDAAADAARATRGLRRGRLDLVSMPSVGIEPLGALLRDLTTAHPGLRVRVGGAFTAEEVVAAVRDGSAEVGLLGAAGDPPAPGLLAVPLAPQRFVVLAAPGTDLGGGARGAEATAGTDAPVGPDALRGRRFVASQEGSLMRRLLDDLAGPGGDPAVVVEVDHRTSVLPLVLAGVGLALVPDSWSALARAAGAAVHPLADSPELAVRLVHRSAHLTPAAQALLAIARRTAPEQRR
ncbi:LysR substrate-binding domain-containing protein [Nocardioides lentus]|uniref:LysR substrate-binding domain-containing protein n=1 Tax=Nocardioides lentus TaxID=338077 RepID=A0ABN2NYH5_9ACTN